MAAADFVALALKQPHQMNRNEFVVIALRLFAIYAWFGALEFFAAGVMSTFAAVFEVQGGLTIGKILSLYAPSLIFLAVGAFLFVRSRNLAARFYLPPAGEVSDPNPPNPLLFASLAFAAVGLAVFLYAAPRLLSYGITLFQIEDAAERMRQMQIELPTLIAAALQVIFGFFLFVYSRAFASTWSRKQPTAQHIVP